MSDTWVFFWIWSCIRAKKVKICNFWSFGSIYSFLCACYCELNVVVKDTMRLLAVRGEAFPLLRPARLPEEGRTREGECLGGEALEVLWQCGSCCKPLQSRRAQWTQHVSVNSDMWQWCYSSRGLQPPWRILSILTSLLCCSYRGCYKNWC